MNQRLLRSHHLLLTVLGFGQRDSGFTGQLDGLSISLTDGSVANVNFEPYPVATDIGSCMKDGWQGLFRSDGSPFKNQGDCIQFVNTGK